MSFKQFDMTAIERARTEYASEAKERWGNTEAYAKSQEKTASYTKEQWEEIQLEAESIYKAFYNALEHGAASTQAQECVKLWQKHISEHFYPCTNEILAGLGIMYVQDSRFTQSIDRFGTGLAKFISEAICVYCAG